MSYPVFYPVEGDTLPILFDTFDGGTGASITMTGLAVTDIEIYKDGGTTQRASDAGYSLLDTDGIDFDGITGIHGFSIDLSDNTTAGFYEVGPWYHVVVSAVTVDGQTVNFVAAAFRIVSATRGLAGTALPDPAADAAGGLPISDAGGLDLDARIGTDIPAILVDTGATLDGEIDSILDDTGTAGVVVAAASKTGYRLSATGVDDILDEAIAEPAGVFTWGGATLRNIVGWLGALARNKIAQTATAQALRNDADGADIATSAVTDDGTTATRGEWT